MDVPILLTKIVPDREVKDGETSCFSLLISWGKACTAEENRYLYPDDPNRSMLDIETGAYVTIPRSDGGTERFRVMQTPDEIDRRVTAKLQQIFGSPKP